MKKVKLIIVENDEDEQLFMREGFDQSGLFEILIQVRNGDVLFKWLDTHHEQLPDLILSDLNMPGKNGYEILSYLKCVPEYAEIPVIITSTSSTNTIINKCLDAGAADYVVKPDTFIDYLPYAIELHRLILEKNIVQL